MNAARRILAALAPVVLAVGLLACSGDDDDGPLGPVALEGIGDDDPVEPPDDEADDPVDADDGARDEDDPPADAAGAGVLDLAGAGTVRVEVVDGTLRLQAIEPADGWRERSRQVDDDEVTLELVRDAGGELDLEVELDGNELRVSWTLEAEPIGEGTIALGDAGELVASLAGDELVLEELRLAPGWVVDDEDVDDDEIELELTSNEAALEVDLELDDGELGLTLTYASS